jgi:hypothetical protein
MNTEGTESNIKDFQKYNACGMLIALLKFHRDQLVFEGNL